MIDTFSGPNVRVHRPLLSIIIPVYNRKSDLIVTLQSLAETTDFSYEVIVVDDGSSDVTDCDVVGTYQRCRLVQKPNGGLASARNAGISAAQGEYLHFLDAGDRPITALGDYLLSVVESGCDIAVCSWLKVTNDDVNELHHLREEIDDPVNLWLQSNVAPVHSYIVRSSFVGSSRFNVTYRYVEDWNFWIRLFLLEPNVKVFPCFSAIYEVTSDSMSNNRLGMAISCCRTAHEIQKLCSKKFRHRRVKAKSVERSTYSQLWAYLKERERFDFLGLVKESYRCGFPNAVVGLVSWILHEKCQRCLITIMKPFSRTPI